MLRRSALLFLSLLGACGSTGDEPETARPNRPSVAGLRGAAVEIVTSRELEELATLEDQRSLGGGRLLELLRSAPDARVRARAATALGRFPFPRFGSELTEALVRALEDSDLAVREAAAFALGLRADPASSGTLLAYRNDPEPRLRARVVEAASRIPDPAVQGPILLSLRDADLGVRLEAALGCARLDPKAPLASEVDRALLDALHPYRIAPGAQPKTAVEAELVWRILWALGRRKAELGRGPFLEYASSDTALERLFAVRGLGQLAPDADSLRAVIAALSGPRAASDWRVAYEATAALGRFVPLLRQQGGTESARGQALAALRVAAESQSPHVRAGAMEALAGFSDEEGVLELLQRGRLDLSVSVRAAALRTRVALSSPADALETLARGAKDDDPVVRAASADAAGASTDPAVVPVLLGLTRDPSLFVATRAVEKLGAHPSDETRRALHGFLAHTDNGLRLAAVLALKEMASPADASALALAAGTSKGDIGAEVAFNALEVLAKIGTNEARATVEAAQDDPRPHVRAVARRLMRDTFGAAPRADELSASEPLPLPVPGKDYPLYRFNPLVELDTTRGSMVFELFPTEAPLHVHNFLTLIERGAYDGLTFHRVVPDFVIQGGDYRGDGNGGRPWQGDALRAEFTPRKYTRGSLGMPRNEDPDSGGSQFFVTHVPTPHLDGRYTIFGELRAGGDVLDLIELGDRILSARVLR